MMMILLMNMTTMMMMMMLLAIVGEGRATLVVAKPGCPSQCGNLSVPYPFGTVKGCYLADKFLITCNQTTDHPPQAFLQNSNIPVVDIFQEGQLRIYSRFASDCYGSSGRVFNNTAFRSGQHRISHTRNKFTAIGCDTYALIQGSVGQRYATGCLSVCNNISDVINGSCSGIGCCQAAIPRGVRNSRISLSSYYNHTNISYFNPCSFAFVAEDGAYNFSSSDLSNTTIREFPMILDWAIGNQSCSEAKKDLKNYACKQNSVCVDSEYYGDGYLCNCTEGFKGNPYLSDANGCQDVNECSDTLNNPCTYPATCQNTEGNFTCSCPTGYEGDGRIIGTRCTRKGNPQSQTGIRLAIGIGIGFSALLVGIMLLYLILKQRQIARLREKYFQQNGGNLLQQQLSQHEGCGERLKIFAAEELEKATNNYHESRILGQGGQGTVYKGILGDGRVVAIKKSRIGDQSQVEPFINEISVLYQINHRNVVKLLGCCLEREVPLLVYEYVTNGTLFDHMHNVGVGTTFLSWEARLRIATETAEAISYLHSAASIPIIHRDIKLANILLDEHFTAKVSDFGASRLIPSDHAQVTTIVQGTFGYLDPEYMQTGQLAEKSDVYSFGVVLIELLTGQKVVCFKRSEEKKVLAMYFVSLMKEDRLLEILDPRVLNDGNIEQFKEIAALAWRCVRVKGEERPTMKEVAHELAGMQAMNKHPWGKSNLLAEEEAEYLLGEMCNTYGNGATSSSMGYDSINNQVPFELEGAR